jgi:hypothetical protein
MKLLLILSTFVICFQYSYVTCFRFSGSGLYDGINDEWTFAYKIASDVNIEYSSNAFASLENATEPIMVDHLSIDWTHLPKDIFLVPVLQFPIAIVFNIPMLTGTLNLTRELLVKMIINDTMTWNDPDLVAMNPSLEGIVLSVRMVRIFNNLINNRFLIPHHRL